MYQERGFNAIRDEHGQDGNDFDLNQYVEITEQGKSYLAMPATQSTPIGTCGSRVILRNR